MPEQNLQYDARHGATVIYTAPVSKYRFVGWDGAHALDAFGVLGVSEHAGPIGKAGSVVTGFSYLVEAAGAIAAGSMVAPSADGTGRAVAASGNSCGRALSAAAAAGELLTVRLQVGGGASTIGYINGSSSYTREQLRAAAEANALTPGVTYRTVEGVIADAKSTRYLESMNWFQGVMRWNAGNATAWKNTLSLMLPPINMPGGAMVEMVHGGICTVSTRNKRVQITVGGTLADAPGTAGVNAYLFNRLLNTASPAQADWETTTRIGAMSSGIMRARSEGSSSEGIGSSETRYFAMDFTSSKLLRVALTTAQSTPAVAVSGLQASGGYAYGTVPAGTFTGASVVRTAQMAGATGGDAAIYNLNPIDIELLTTGLPSPVLAPVDITAANVALVTAFRYPLAAVPSGNAAGSPTIQLFDELALEHLRLAIFQGAI